MRRSSHCVHELDPFDSSERDFCMSLALGQTLKIP